MRAIEKGERERNNQVGGGWLIGLAELDEPTATLGSLCPPSYMRMAWQ